MLTSNRKTEYWSYLILFALIFFSFYYAIGAYPLFDNNEGLYASIAKNMLLYKDFIIPHLNGVPYIEKPPFLYWLISGSFSLLGFTAFAARLVTATSAALVCVAILFFSKKIKEERAGIIASMIFASSIGVSIIARMVYFDMLFTCLITLSLLCLFCWHQSSKKSFLRFAYVFVGFAVLTKGLIAGVIIGGSFLAFLIIEKDFRKIYQTLDPTGILIFLAVTLPWHITAIIQHKNFFWGYIVEEHFLRFLDQRVPHDYYHGPIYYYLPRMMIYLFPWSLFAPLIFWRTKGLSDNEKSFLKLNWCWLIIPLLFFSLSSAKANYYMIVSMPAIACILGVKLIHLAKYHLKTLKIWSVSVLLIVSLAIGVIFSFVKVPHLKEIGNFLVFATILYGVSAAAVSLFVTKKLRIIVALVSALIIPMILIMVSYIKVIENDLSTAGAGVYLSENAKDKPLYIYQDFENISAVGFYAPSYLKIIDTKSNDLYYGSHHPEYKNFFLNKKEFLKEDLSRQIYIVVPAGKAEQFKNYISPLKVFPLKQTKRAVIFSNKKK